MKPFSDRPARIAIFFSQTNITEWIAGLHYLKNLLIALKSIDEDRPEIILLSPQGIQIEDLRVFVDEVIYLPQSTFHKKIYNFLYRKLHLHLWPKIVLEPYLRKHQIDAIFTTVIEFGPLFDFSLITWIPDFQYLHLPEFFPLQLRKAMNDNFLRIAKYADYIVLSSQDALKDFQQLTPHLSYKARVVPFVADIPPDVYNLDPKKICDLYHLPERFFYLPNQFWQHKNHKVVLEALSLLQNQYPELTVVCTGSPNDHRDPGVFNKLLMEISRKNLRNNFIILGLLPHKHVFQLMRYSLAVLQPSLFEGWSTTVEEVKSLGKQIILSDIPVHREQSPPKARYFDPHSPEELAEYLAEVFCTEHPGPDNELELLAREQLPVRKKEFGKMFVNIFKEVLFY